MLGTFKQNIQLDKFFRDGNNFAIKRQSDYISYTEFLKYFSDLNTITRHNLIIGINFTYGWMPTIFDFRSDNFKEALDILNDAKTGVKPTVENLVLLKGLLNNSLVGTTKLLHFINPDNFAIWDSRVYRYLTNQEPYNNRIGNCNTYIDYLAFCDYLTKQSEFETLQKIIESKIGYSMTAFRVAELVMYSNGINKMKE
ncbi:hypothetical protein [Cyclobacterium xiamenense]|uniref:hypothetical protein n=1 Tax=Cyclobacterium xiamenense TaxID=1297121 RepID=UPI0012B90669|nr:hypothetical protein [Cyclobacterium xiamenense]